MFGSSCAKYLCKMSAGASIALVGPGEPEDRADTEVSQLWTVGNIFIDMTKCTQLPSHSFSRKAHHTNLLDLEDKFTELNENIKIRPSVNLSGSYPFLDIFSRAIRKS